MTTNLRLEILKACNGEPTNLPYSPEQMQVSLELRREGFIQSEMEDDQPTSSITEKGKRELAQMRADLLDYSLVK